MRRFALQRSSTLLILLLATLAGACSKAKSAAESAVAASDTDPAYTPVPGDPVSAHLASAHDVAAIDPTTLAKALGVAQNSGSGNSLALLDGSGAVGQTDTDTINLLKASGPAKASLDPTIFPNPGASTFAQSTPQQQAALALDGTTDSTPIIDDPTTHNYTSDTITATSWNGGTLIMVSRIGQIPVRNQANRGTCAAHAGTGALDYLILKKYFTKLTTVDLSPERFYLMSKEDLWAGGGNGSAGSSWSNGYAVSMGLPGYTVPSANTAYNIPLEDDCPYNGTQTSNELQMPQPTSCETGAVKVSSMSQTYYYLNGSSKEWHSTGLLTAQDIMTYLVTKDLPVPVAANITQNWENNDGIITYAADQSNPQIVGGHAFMIVGARQIDNTQYPNEGGMCFIIKNSWGPGWATNGFSCMTLAWWNNFREKQVFDVAFDVNVDIDYVLTKAQKGVPSGVKASLLDSGTEPNPLSPVPLSPAPTNPGTSDLAAADSGSPASAPVPPPSTPSSPSPSSPSSPASSSPAAPTPTPSQTTSDGYTYASLVDQSGALLKALYKIDGSNIDVVGIMSDEASVTSVLTLPYDSGSGNISYNDPVRGLTVVGNFSGSTINLCGQQYASVCLLHVVTPANTLVIGLTEMQYDTYTPDPNASYTSLVAFAGYGIDFSVASVNYIDLRLELDNTPTNAIRLKVDPVGGSIHYGGREVGNYQQAALCSGSYNNVCRFIVNGDDHSLNLFLKTEKGGGS